MPMQMPAAMPAPAPQPCACSRSHSPCARRPKEADARLIEIKSPMIGTFYRKPSPDKDNFVEVGLQSKWEILLCNRGHEAVQ